LVRWDRVSPALLRDVNARAVLVSGNSTEFEHYPESELAGLRAVFCEAARPTLAFCGGCHLLAQSYGAPVGAIGPLPVGMLDPYPEYDYSPGMRQERGFMPVQVTAPHPLFDGLGQAPVMFESHYWEVKALPEGFRAYAETGTCRLQMLAHERLPVFATQFHPEQYDDEHPDGRRFLENFFRFTGIAGATGAVGAAATGRT
jgi:GMP synthase-like glutamine amidotransferase